MEEQDQLTDADFQKLNDAMRDILSKFDPDWFNKQKVEQQLSNIVNNAEIEMMQEEILGAWQKLSRHASIKVV